MTKAIILAGGRGVRLRPYTVALPKPLMPIGEYPILEIIVRQLAFYGFTHITMAVNHQADIIKAYFGDGSKWNLNIDYSLEEKYLSTMGPLTLVDNLPENFLVMNGDVLSDLNYKNLLETHANEKNIFTISAHKRQEKVDYGVLETNDSSMLTNFNEKPIHEYLVSMGIYAVSRRILEFIPKNAPFGFDNLMYLLLDKKIAVKVAPYSGYWLDIGRPDDYMQAVEEFENMRHIFKLQD
ncbi:MAG: sugar phosphate nucleotidyltransferase [Firmicutes bacterium]|nr:sugar phosphate nucleotidyltransferase [Bacillota bacterium]